MRAGIRISSLVPSGLVIESVSDSSDSIILAVRSDGGMAECPLCGARSRRIHSRYDRQVADLPCRQANTPRVITRRFVCEVHHCRRRIFAERFGDDVLPTRSRRTGRLECIVHHLGQSVAARVRMSSGHGRARSMPTCPFWMRNGTRAAVTAQSSGVVCKGKASKAPCV